MMLISLIIITLVTIGGFFSLFFFTRREDPYGCFIFFGLLFLSCLAGLIVPQVI